MGGHARPLHAGQERAADTPADHRPGGRGDDAREHSREIADLFERVGEAESSAEALPHRRKYLLLIMGFMRDLLDLHVELVDRVERELEPGDGDDQPKNASARA